MQIIINDLPNTPKSKALAATLGVGVGSIVAIILTVLFTEVIAILFLLIITAFILFWVLGAIYDGFVRYYTNKEYKAKRDAE